VVVKHVLINIISKTSLLQEKELNFFLMLALLLSTTNLWPTVATILEWTNKNSMVMVLLLVKEQ